MIHDEICTYEVAMLAKEKGFPQYITDEAYIVDNYGEDDYNIGDRLPIPLVPDYMDDVNAPTQSLLQRWLREEKGLIIAISVDIDHDLHRLCYQYGICYDFDGRTMEYHNCYDAFGRYEIALEDALKYALENLV